MELEKLKDKIHKEVTKLFEKTLDFGEVAIGDGGNYRAFRSKILRMGNGCIRELHKWVDENFVAPPEKRPLEKVIDHLENAKEVMIDAIAKDREIKDPEIEIELPIVEGDK